MWIRKMPSKTRRYYDFILADIDTVEIKHISKKRILIVYNIKSTQSKKN